MLRAGAVRSALHVSTVTSGCGTTASEEIVDWYRNHAIPLQTIEPGNGFDDLAPFRDLVGDARIVALGEATHGTHEFNVVRHRLIEFLVTEMDFNVIAIEASAANVERLNRYVLYGEGSPSALVNQQIIGFWTVGT